MASIPSWRRHSLEPIIVHTGIDSSTHVGPNIYHSFQPILQELECQNPSSLQEKGMLTWTLHQNVEKDPSKATLVVEELVKDLERVQMTDKKGCIIPLLVTLIYVIFQSVYIPKDLYDRAHAACKSLLKLPKPQCDVALACLRHMQTEMSKPGALYQRTVIAENNLWNECFPFQEMMFVFADAAVFTDPLGDAVKQHLKASRSRQPSVSHMRAVLQHTLQAALGNDCRGNTLAHALMDMGGTIEPNFLELVRTVEQNAEEAGHEDKASGYTERLQQLYHHILSAAGEGEPSGGSLCDTPLPTPDVRFHLWREDTELWLQLDKWILQSLAEAAADMHPTSRFSRDSGIEKDLPETETSEAPPGGSRVYPSQKGQEAQHDGRASVHKWVRKACMRKKPARAVSLPLPMLTRQVSLDLGLGISLDGNGDTNLCNFTACVMVMGDDRVLGRLAKAYHSLRTGGASLSHMSRVNLEMYYIPVADQHTAMEGSPPGQSSLDMASHLGRADPWYECNINSLAHWITKLKETANDSRSLDPNPFLLDVLSYYKRTAWQPAYFTIYSVKIFCLNKRCLEEVFLTHLEVDFAEIINTKVETGKKEATPTICGPVVSITYRKVSLNNRQVDEGKSCRTTGILIRTIPSDETEGRDHDQLTLCLKETQPKTSMEPHIRSRNIKIKTLENKTFTVRLDKDTRRTYKDVQSIEISPCQDPRCIWTEDLSLPINTFSGINR